MRARTYLRELLQPFLSEHGLDWSAGTTLEPPKDKRFGDLATNMAFTLSKKAGKNPRQIAEDIAQRLQHQDDRLAKVETAGPGFLNFTLAPSFWQQGVLDILAQGDGYGAANVGDRRKVQVEYVSANPTGPLHIGHGRGAALGDSLARILRFMGYDVTTEYYLNDAGRQMRLLGASVLARYRELCGREAALPEDGYKGEYIRDLAQGLLERDGQSIAELPESEALDVAREFAVAGILDGIKQDLLNFRVEHQVWFSESRLIREGAVENTLQNLHAAGLAYEQDGALWFASTRYGDDKDRVLRKSDGSLTYLASDIAYHADKYQRGFDLVVDIWGADHHGYVGRMKAAVQALGRDPDDLQVILVQLVNLLRAGEQIAMSTRAGKFETLADVCAEVGEDAARFIFLSRKSDSHLDFDLELVKRQTMDNPVYYVQYAHARIHSLLSKALDAGIALDTPNLDVLTALDTEVDLQMLRALDQFGDVLVCAAGTLSPHHLSHYLMDLAGKLHRYYTTHPVLAAGSSDLVQARLALCRAVAQVLRNGLDLLGVSAPEKM
ncbi:arginyl-tRNA synthetase [Desulfonatronum thiosulfatophilum]|uniref:Arginine--tRNA ligase n=1 Tax=Desulfonatronum thiosulfatophilum TaxID=617002 RepID=A0A1G6CVD4_9BACT|nr:arginine--tRNA ligase [Desulfonatronum thiosulfatophilum]SDB36820.1 arginyl-tRNA synthetase [Desulfonatronum thiosulfatophilum]